MADRNKMGAVMSSDTIPFFFEHLQSIQKTENIDLFLYTRGGHTLTPNRIVHLLREYCKKLSILIPFRAHSAGTTLALGADEVVMCPMGELGPTDPSVANTFNPLVDEKDLKKGYIPISVEDVSAYMSLVKDKVSEDPSVLSAALKALSDKIHPLSLGNIHRQYLLIRSLSKRLLQLHMKGEGKEEKINSIIDYLTEKLYFHGYEISRHEAKETIGLNVVYPSEKLEKLMWDLYTAYAEALLPGQEVDFEPIIGGRTETNFIIDIAVIESENLLHACTCSGKIKRSRPGKPEFEVNDFRSGWSKL